MPRERGEEGGEWWIDYVVTFIAFYELAARGGESLSPSPSLSPPSQPQQCPSALPASVWLRATTPAVPSPP